MMTDHNTTPTLPSIEVEPTEEDKQWASQVVREHAARKETTVRLHGDFADHMSEIQRLGDLIRMIEANIEERETAIKVIRKERSKLVAQRYRLQKAAGLK